MYDEYAYIGRDNVIRRTLLIDGKALTNDEKAAVNRVTVGIGPFCLDTVIGDNISYSDGVINLTIGLIEGIKRGKYNAEVTVYDPIMTNGKAWGSFTVYVDTWDACNDS
jgi:hypothetical protein